MPARKDRFQFHLERCAGSTVSVWKAFHVQRPAISKQERYYTSTWVPCLWTLSCGPPAWLFSSPCSALRYPFAGWFYQRDAMQKTAVFADARYLSVCPFVTIRYIISKRLNISSKLFHHLISSTF